MSDRIVRLSYSDDGGENWSEWEEESIGEVGEYRNRAVFTRLGNCRNRVFRIQASSPRKRDLLGAVAVVQPTEG